MTTPDLEGLAREHEEKADFHGNEANIWSQPGKMSAFRQQRASEEGALAQAHRQAAALIRSAPAPGREEISNEIHIALQRLHYADLLWIAGSADGFERATLAIADHLLSALFHAPADPGGGREGVSEGVEVSLARIHALAVEGVSGSVRLEVSERMKVIRDALASPTPPAGDGWTIDRLRALVRFVWGYVDRHPNEPGPLGEPTDEAVDRIIAKHAAPPPPVSKGEK